MKLCKWCGARFDFDTTEPMHSACNSKRNALMDILYSGNNRQEGYFTELLEIHFKLIESLEKSYNQIVGITET